jgi:hypothetical protein
VNRTGYEGKTPSCLIMPSSSLTAQCSATLPSETRNQCDCWLAKRLPLSEMPQSSPSWVAVHVPRTATVSPSAAVPSISKRWSGKMESSHSIMCLSPPRWY